MPSEVYEVIAQGARYWFVFLMALIVWRSYRWYQRDRRQRKKRLRLLPDAGYIGEMVVIAGGEGLEPGMVLPVAREGTLGYLRTNDLCVPVDGVGKKQLWFLFEEEKGLMIEPFRGRAVSVDGREFQSRSDPLYMTHGSRLYVGQAELRLRFFAGFEAQAKGRAQARSFGDEPRKDNNQAQAMPDSGGMTRQEYEYWQRQWMLEQMRRQQGAEWDAEGSETEANDSDFAFGDEAAMEAFELELAENSELEEALPEAAHREDINAAYRRPSFAPTMGSAAVMDASGDADDNQTVFETNNVFYPPIDQEEAEGRQWPYALYPQSDAEFVNQGYTYPEYLEDEDEDMTDAAAPPKSAYIGHDEAEQAKKKLWDKYLGGGHGR